MEGFRLLILPDKSYFFKFFIADCYFKSHNTENFKAIDKLLFFMGLNKNMIAVFNELKSKAVIACICFCR